MASPSQTQVSPLGQRESELTLSNPTSRPSVPTMADCPTCNSKLSPRLLLTGVDEPAAQPALRTTPSESQNRRLRIRPLRISDIVLVAYDYTRDGRAYASRRKSKPSRIRTVPGRPFPARDRHLRAAAERTPAPGGRGLPHPRRRLARDERSPSGTHGAAHPSLRKP